ncbi:MAG: ABC-2 type transport system permease protein, partial [Phenylobacterium sp.]
GMLAFVLFTASDFMMEPLGLGHNMFRFSHSPALVYSDMNGYGVSLLSHSWYMLYWGALSLALSIIGYGLWQRGPQQGLKVRLFALGYQLGRGGKQALTASLAVFIISGSTIFYNTRVLNPYYDKAQLDQFHVEYEQRYSPWADAPIPTMTKLNAAVDIFPHQRKVNINSQIVISNKTAEPISRFLVSMPGYNPIFVASPGYQPIDFSLEIEGGKLGPVDGALNTHWFEFDQPLQPGEHRQGRFATVIQHQGFTDKRPTMQLIENGTFLQNTEIFPRFGYRRSEQLIDPDLRKTLGLPPTLRAHPLGATEHYDESIAETMLGLSSGYIEFETTVSTSADQIAIAPGYLQKEWLEGERRYFHYKMDAPIENYFAYLSGRYQSLETSHQTPSGNVDIGIYYHPAHDKNIGHMQQTVKDALDYYSASFGAYQHRQSRVIEIPGPRVFAQDFPNTVAYAERSGFITNLTDPNGIDPLYYMTAHEIAHQWWGGQVDGANVQGGTMLVETLAQYSALMLSKKKYGEGKLRAMLRLELDSYLKGRSREVKQELPLLKEENQPYLHYNKGSLAMMALVDLLGETRLNLALKRFINQYKYSQLNDKHYPTTLDLMALINHDTSEREQLAIERLFGQINLYDLKMDKAEVVKTPDNQFEVTLTIQAKRFIADGQGNEKPAPLAALVDIGLFSSDPDDLSQDLTAGTLYRQKHLLSSGENVITVIVPSKPLFAGVDPFVRFIDRNSGDNLLAL